MAVRLAVISDFHYYSKRLGITGRAYELRSGSDQKALGESEEVIDSVFSSLAGSDADAVLGVGDITNDGEAVSHEEIREKLLRLNEAKPVYLITSTHDWCSDGNPRRFEGREVFHDVPAWGIEDLNRAYACFGAERELARFETRLGQFSRVFQIAEGLRLIAVNDDADGAGGASGYSDAHLDWMREQLAAARGAGDRVIAMEHHLLLYNLSPLINKGQSIADNYDRAAALADAGLRLMLVGHSHMQRTTEYVSPAGNKITQINVGALCGYPAPVVWLTVENGEAKAELRFVESFDLNGGTADASFFRDHTSAVLLNLLNAAATDKEDLRERLAAQGIRIKPYDKIYPLLRFAAKKALTVSVGKAGRLVNVLTFGKGVDKKAVKALKDDRLLDHILTLFLSVFDGSVRMDETPEAVKTIARGVGTLPRRVIRRLPLKREKKEKIRRTTDQIEALVEELVNPSAPDNAGSVIEL